MVRDQGQRLCVSHAPADPGAPARAAVVFVHPFVEEMNKSRHVVAAQARALAAAQCAVLQIDLLGCGDSSGDLTDASWSAWLADVQAGCDWMTDRHPGAPLWLWGLRAGALLAGEAASRCEPPANLLLWQPVSAGKQQVAQFLRLKAAAQLGDGAQARALLDGLRQTVVEGGVLDVAGYLVSGGLLRAFEQASLVCPPPPAQIRILELSSRPDATLSPGLGRLVAGWMAEGRDLSASVVQGPAFWQTVELEDAPALLQATLAALGLTSPGAATRPPNAGKGTVHGSTRPRAGALP